MKRVWWQLSVVFHHERYEINKPFRDFISLWLLFDCHHQRHETYITWCYFIPLWQSNACLSLLEAWDLYALTLLYFVLTINRLSLINKGMSPVFLYPILYQCNSPWHVSYHQRQKTYMPLRYFISLWLTISCLSSTEAWDRYSLTLLYIMMSVHDFSLVIRGMNKYVHNVFFNDSFFVRMLLEISTFLFVQQ